MLDCCLMHGAEKKGSAASRGSLLAETCVASTAFVSSLQEKALAEARSAAEEALKQRKASQAGASASPAGQPVCGRAGERVSSLQSCPSLGVLPGCWSGCLQAIASCSPAHHLLGCHSQLRRH